MKFIIADDHLIVRRGIKEIIQDEFPQAHVYEVSDAETLINRISKEHFDLAITDITMPGRNGLEALQQIRTLKPSLPVIVLSIHPESQYAIRAFKNGAKGYLNKDAAPNELVTAIKQVLSGKKYITENVAENFFGQIERDQFPLHQLLSNREFEVLKLIAEGKSNSDIARQLLLSETTVSTYKNRILEKLQLKSTADIVRYVIQEKLL